MDSNNSAPWFLTVIRTQGMRLMRPDKEWRPVITLEVRDPHHHRHEAATPQAFETLMGVDGQNPNLKHGLYIPGPVPTSPSSSSASISSTSSSTSARFSPVSNVRLNIGVWYTPPAQGKKKAKSKKRILVGSSELSVGELVKLWEKEREKGRGALDLRLTCHSPTKGAVSSRNGAVLTVRLHPPPPPPTPTTSALVDVPRAEVYEIGEVPREPEDEENRPDRRVRDVSPDEEAAGTEEDNDVQPRLPAHEEPPESESEPSSSTEDDNTTAPSESESTAISTPQPEPITPPAPQGLRRRRKAKPTPQVKGYACSSSSSCSTGSGSGSGSDSGCTSEPEECEDDEEQERQRFIEQWCGDEDGGEDENEVWGDGKESNWVVGAVVSVAASLLPQHTLASGSGSGAGAGAGVLENEAAAAWRAQRQQRSDSKATLPAYTERVEVADPEAMTLPERVLATFTLYAALRAARVDSEFEAVFTRLQMEWGYVGGLLVALAAVDTAVLSISPDAVFTVHEYARGAIAASSVAAGLGIACDAWFLLRYGWAEVGVVRTRALDVFNTYFFFALSARTPSFCMFLAAISLMTFLALVAFDAWPGGVLIVCGGVGLVMGLQFLVWGAVWLGKGVRGAGRGVGRVGRGVVGAVAAGRGRASRGGSGEKVGC